MRRLGKTTVLHNKGLEQKGCGANGLNGPKLNPVLGGRGGMSRGATGVCLLLALLATPGCRYRFERDEATALIKRVGAERVVNGVKALRASDRSRKREVPKSQWPDVIQELEPAAVFVDDEGVWIAKSSGFVEGEGLLIVFPGDKDPEERWGDPSIWRVGKGVFWYQFTG